MSNKTRNRMNNNDNSTPSTKSKEKLDSIEISNQSEIIVNKKDLLYLQHMLSELQDYKKMFNEKLNFIDDCK